MSIIKHFFIINPTAGKGKVQSSLFGAIEDACHVAKADYEIYKTTGKSDATRFVREKIKEKPEGEIWRFYACGGDGTLSEVVNGAVDAECDPSMIKPIPGVEVGCIPVGTGNDFVRNFTSPEFFGDITKQLLADSREIDCYSCNGGRYGINMINIGFDCDVVIKAAEFKRHPLTPKGLAYVLGIAATFIKNLGCKIAVSMDNEKSEKQEFQLVSAANGGFCGGGFHSAPESSLDDGFLDVSLIKKVSRFNFLRLVGRYKKGTHLKTRLGRKIVEYKKARTVDFFFEKPTNVCIDGDVVNMEHLHLSVIPKGIAFVIPVGCRIRKNG